MTQVNMADAKEKFGDLVKLLKSKEQDEIILTEDGKPTIKMTFLENAPTEKKSGGYRRLGIAKGALKLTPDFDKVFDDLDEEIGKMFFKEELR